MATSTCIKCGNTEFEAKEAKPLHSNFRLYFIQCAHCGAVVGAMDYLNIGYFVKKIADKLSITETGQSITK